MLQHGAHNARRPLRPQGDGTVPFVLERVHFLLHNVGGFSNRALEKLRMLKHGGAYFAKTVNGGLAAHYFLHRLPAGSLLGEEILRPFGSLCQ